MKDEQTATREARIGAWIRQYRKVRKWTLEDFEQKSRIDGTLLSRLERGKKKFTSRDVLLISKAFGVTEQEILRHGSSPKRKAVPRDVSSGRE